MVVVQGTAEYPGRRPTVKDKPKVAAKVLEKLSDKGRERNRNSVRSFRGGEQVRCTWSHRDSISSENDLGTQLLSVCWGVAAWEGSSTSTAEPNQDMATHPPVQDRP